MPTDPFNDLFSRFQTHCADQLGLSKALLDLANLNHDIDRLDRRRTDDGADTNQIDRQWTALDDKRDELRKDIRDKLERLTGVNFEHIQAANL
jgi:hypothetical protein